MTATAMKAMSLRLPESLADELAAIARTDEVKISEAVRVASTPKSALLAGFGVIAEAFGIRSAVRSTIKQTLISACEGTPAVKELGP